MTGADNADTDPADIGPLLGRGGVAEVFAYGDRALKLFFPAIARAAAFGEAAALAAVAEHGLPVPEVHAVGNWDGRWGLVMDRVAGVPLAAFTPDGPVLAEGGLAELLRLHRAIHAVTDIRPANLKQRLGYRIAGSSLDPDLRTALLARLAALPDGDRLCHGDFHPFNVIGSPGRTTVIDWLDVASGAPAADVARTHLLVSAAAPALAEAYVAAYAEATGLRTAEIIDWLPVLAAARLAAEGVDAGEATRLLAIAERIA